MSTPPRRSSRIRGGKATPKTVQYASGLESLAERNETPTSGGVQYNLNSIVSSPMAPRTPAIAPRPKPSHAEMHPSHAHQSTTKQPDSGLRLGFADMNSNGGDQPSGISQHSPSRAGISATFDFSFARPGGSELGTDAQRMMDELRGEALKIKARLVAEREKRKAEEEAKRQVEADGAAPGRKIAQPKGKAGRYSDAHMAEFKKMDSIANHPSAYRAQNSRFTPSTTSLKRTQSKANLDERKEVHKAGESERLENAAPAKRARKAMADDTSSARPVSSSGLPQPKTPNHPRASNLLDSITTPTQASLARSTGAKGPATQIPTLSRSPSKPNLLTGTPRGMTKSATTNDITTLPKSSSKSFLRSPGKFEHVKSILRNVSPRYKKPALTHSSIPSSSRNLSKPDFEKSLPSLPITPGASKPVKHVNFTPETINRNSNAGVQASPSPMKAGIPRSISKFGFGMKVGPPSISKSAESKVAYPAIVSHPNIVVERSPYKVEYPSLAGARPLPAKPTAASQRPPPSVPGTFTFRSDHTINFGASPEGFGSASGQASVRQVRQSMAPLMPGSFPGTNKENTQPLPSVPHGMSNKKRKHTGPDEEEEVARSPKKQKPAVAEGEMLMAPRLIATPKSRLSTSPAKSPKKGVLSMSRLNMLARPKMRN